MSEQEINEIIAKNLSALLGGRGKTQLDLADFMGVSQATVSNWCKGVKLPRMDKIDRICEYFNVKRSDLMDDASKMEHETGGYYIDDEVARLAQEIYDDPDKRILFSATRDISKEDMQLVIDMVKRFKSDD